MAKAFFVQILLFTLTQHFASANANNQTETQAKYKQVHSENVLTEIQKSNEKYLPREFQLVTWNTQKSNNKDLKKIELKKLIQQHQMILLQETLHDSEFNQVFTEDNLLHIQFAASFYLPLTSTPTGLTTLATAQPRSVQYRRSQDREAYVLTPKMTLIEEYLFDDNDPLLVINIHSLNITDDQKFKQQINELTPLLKTYQGKIIFAGDFNTWNTNRMIWLEARLKEFHLARLNISSDKRKLRLDHIYTKGCRAIQTELLNDYRSSDHTPLSTQLDCH